MPLDKEITVCEQCRGVISEGTDHLCPVMELGGLRDKFAMAAPIPIREGDRETPLFAENCARRYRWADAMLEARKK